MDKRTSSAESILSQGLLPLYFHPDPNVSLHTLEALYDAGIRAVEYTNRGPDALRNFSMLSKLAVSRFEGLYLGAGTIKTGQDAHKFCEAGADFLVSPGISADIFDAAYSQKTLWIPGCMTPSEVMQAVGYGLNMVKIFPAGILGPSHISALREVFPAVSFLPTGGVDIDEKSLSTWLKCGVAAVGIGSKLIDRQSLDNHEFDKIRQRTIQTISTIKQVREALRN